MPPGQGVRSSMKGRLFAELRRRNVFKAAAAYLALGWVVTQVTSTVAPALHMPDWIVPVVVWIGVIGFPFVIMFSWIYELTPEGLKRESEVDHSASITHITSRRLDYITISLLVLAIGLFAFDRFVPRRVEPPAASREAQTPAASDNSIAVLPFVNMSSDKEQDFFSDGISEELLNAGEDSAVAGDGAYSSFAFKGKETGIPEIARTLHVAHVLEGSVRKSGDQLGSRHSWCGHRTVITSGRTYDRKLDDIFKIQDEIAGKVVEHLRVSLLGAAPQLRATDPKAFALYLQARELARQNTAAAIAKSDALYQQALAIDPNYAPAWNGLAVNHRQESIINMVSSQEGYARAREAAQKALSIDPDYAPAHATLGRIADSDNDLAGAARHFERALAIDPTDSDVLLYSAELLRGVRPQGSGDCAPRGKPPPRSGERDGIVLLGRCAGVRRPLRRGYRVISYGVEPEPGRAEAYESIRRGALVQG